MVPFITQAYDPRAGYDIAYFRTSMEEAVRGQDLPSPQEVNLLIMFLCLNRMHSFATDLLGHLVFFGMPQILFPAFSNEVFFPFDCRYFLSFLDREGSLC